MISKKDFFEWHEYVEKFILGKEEKENLILRRHLKKVQNLFFLKGENMNSEVGGKS